MQALEIGHFRCITGFNQCFKAGADELNQAAAKHNLLTEQVGLAFFLEGGFDDAGAAAADGGGIRQAKVMRIARSVLRNGNEARHAAAALIFRTHGMAGALGGNHQHVNVLARLDQVEMHIQAVGKQQGRAGLHVGGKFSIVNVGLQFVRGQHHDDIRPFRRFRNFHNGQTFTLSLGGRARTFAQSDHKVFHARITHVEHMGMTLRAIANNSHFFALDQA